MAQHKIPAFMSKKFNRLSPEEKSEWLKLLESWKASPITENLLEWLSEAITRDESEEDTTVLEDEFKTLQSYSWHKGHRVAIRKVIKQIEKDK